MKRHHHHHLNVAATLNGDNGGNDLTGTSESDILNGRGGADTLNGKDAPDILIGGDGSDRFDFNSRIGVDAIMDLTPGEDTVVISHSGVAPPIPNGSGYSAPPFPGYDFDFVKGGAGAATTHDPTVIYNPNNGKMFYDYDGAGGHDAVNFAVAALDLSMHHRDFLLLP